MTDAPHLTQLIHQAQQGDAGAADVLFAAVYPDLRRLARARLRAGSRNTYLDTGALVHEAYLRFAGTVQLKLESRLHFMRWVSCVMRSVIVDFVRRRQACRRGGGAAEVHTDLDHMSVASGEREILRVHDALTDLAAVDERVTQVVEMRYFGGMTEVEIAEALGVTDRTVRRDWEKARVLLREALA